MRRSLLRCAAATLFAIGVSTCADEATGPRTRLARIALAARFEGQQPSGAASQRSSVTSIDNVHVVVRRPSGEQIAEKTVAFPPGVDEVPVVLEVPLQREAEPLEIRLELRTGTTMLFSGTANITATATSSVGEPPAPVTIPVSYQGPGKLAQALIVDPAEATLIINSSRQLTVSAFAANEDRVTDLPIDRWTTSDGNVATVSGTGLVQALAKTGTVTITAHAANLLSASATVRVIGAPTRLTVVGGGGQAATVGSALAQPFVVSLTNDDGIGVPGIAVAFRAVTPGGAVGVASAVTDAQGRAATTMTLGTAAGPYVYEARITSLSSIAPITVSQSALPGSPAAIELVSGDRQTGAAGTVLGQAMVVRVKDASGNPVPSVVVRWTRISGTGAVDVETSTTDAAGTASARYTLGRTPGAEVIRADVSGVTVPVTFTLTSAAGAAALISVVSGDRQTIVAGRGLTEGLVVVVTDALGNPVSGATVRWTRVTGGGSLAQPTSVTEANGRAVAPYDAGTIAGAASVRAEIDGVAGVSATFTLTVVPGLPSRITVVAGADQSARVGTVVPTAPSVRVADEFGNPIAGITVNFTVNSGGGSIIGASEKTTNAEGIAAVDGWQLGPFPGDNSLAVAAGPILASIHATGTTGTAASIAAAPNVPLQVIVEAGSSIPFPALPSVVVRDAAGNVAPGAQVSFVASGGTITPPNGSGTSPIVATADANGVVTLMGWTLPTAIGTYTVTASLPGVTGASVVFTATVVASVPAAIAPFAGENQSAPIGGSLAVDPAARVTDRFGNPVAGVSVTFRVVTGGGAVENGSAPTNANGVASSGGWTLGTELGAQTLTASFGALSTTFHATAIVGSATSMQAAPNAPLAITGIVGTPVPDGELPAVVVRDAGGNPLPGITVHFVASGGSLAVGGSITDVDVTTDASGRAGIAHWTLPTALGSATLTASLVGTGVEVVTFTATTRAGAPNSLAKQGDGQSGAVNVALPQLPTVIVRDAFGNPAAGVAVTFTVATGGGRVSAGGPFAASVTVQTDGNGAAQVTWQLGGAAGTQTLGASTPGVPAVTFTATASAGAAASIVAAPNVAVSFTAAAGSTVDAEQLPAVIVRDADGNPINGAAVTFVAGESSGAIGGGSGGGGPVVVETDASGLARLGGWALPTSVGVATVTATVAGLTDYAVVFTATVVAGAPASVALTTFPSSPTQSGVPFVAQPAIQLRDAFGNTASGADRTVSASLSPGSVAAGYSLVGPTTTSTGSSGAAVFVGLGVRGPVGAATIVFSVDGLTPATVTVSVGTGPATSIAPVPGVPLSITGLAGGTVPAGELPAVVVRDAGGNPVPGAVVRFVVSAGSITGVGGSPTGTALDAATDGEGRATIGQWTLPTTPTTVTVTASLTGAAVEPVTFSAAVSVRAANLVLVSGNDQRVTAGAVAGAPLVVRVTDRFGNAVSGAPVYWFVLAGTATLSDAQTLTDVSGLTAVTLATGTLAEAVTIGASLVPEGGADIIRFQIQTVAGGIARIGIVDGDQQTAIVGTTVSTAPRVRVTDENDNPIQGALVRFSVPEGSGILTGESATTNAQGVATVGSWRLGTIAGPQTLLAVIGDLSASIHATANPGPAARLTLGSGDQQRGSIGDALADPFVVVVSDQYGNLVGGASVRWTRIEGSGAPESPISSSNAAGEASMIYTLGSVAGDEIVQAELSNAPTVGVRFTATATARGGSFIELVDGNDQRAAVGEALEVPLSVRVTDVGENLVNGAGVSWTVTSGSATLSGSHTFTNASGLTAITAILGTRVGPVVVRATLSGPDGGGAFVEFTLTALAGAPARISVDATTENQSAATSVAVPYPPTVRVTDRYDNPLAGVTVVFGVGTGGGSVTGALQVTNASGAAIVGSWTLGTRAGQQTLIASVASLSATIHATALPTLSVNGSGTGSGRVTSVPAGIDCSLPARTGSCTATFTPGASVTLMAASDVGSSFAGWANACTGAQPTCTVQMDQQRQLTAAFSRLLSITVLGAGSGDGTVRSTPAGIDCTVRAGTPSGICAAEFPNGTRVTLTETHPTTSSFDGWSGDCTGAACQITVDRAYSVTASFTALWTLAVAGAGAGSGTVRSTAAGIDCTITAGVATGDCSETVTQGTTITLNAASTGNSQFAGWSGACAGTGPCTVTMDQARSVTATFVRLYTLSVQPTTGNAGNGSVSGLNGASIACSIAGATASGTCSQSGVAQSTISLLASAPTGYVFTGWGGACASRGTSSTCTVTLSADQTVTASFAVGAVLTVSTGGGVGTGTVTSNPAGINCRISPNGAGGACTATFPIGTVVGLSGSPDANYRFAGFGGACAGTFCSLTMSVNRSVTASFAGIQYYLAVGTTAANNGRGHVTGAGLDCLVYFYSPTGTSSTSGACSVNFDPNTVVTISAAPEAGYMFTGWGGACASAGTAPTCQVTITANTTVQATFVVARTLSVNGGGSKASGRVTSSPEGVDCSISPTGALSGACVVPFPLGTFVSLQPVSVGNSVFTNWGVDCFGSGLCGVRMDVDHTVAANFVPGFHVAVALSGSGTGRVTSDVPGIDCSFTGGVTTGICEFDYQSGTNFTLTASAAGSSTFSGWSAPCPTSPVPTLCALRPTANVTVSGSFQTAASSWAKIASPTTQTLRAVAGISTIGSGTVYLVGDGGTVLRGTTSSALQSIAVTGVTTSSALRGVWASNSTNVFIVGRAGTRVRGDGTTWISEPGGGAIHFNAVGGYSATRVFATWGPGAGSIAVFDGTSWTFHLASAANNLLGVWSRSDAEAYAVGSGGAIYRYAGGTTWTAMTSGTTAELQSVWGTATDVFAVGVNGTILRYDGTAWRQMVSGTAVTLHAVTGTSSTNVYAVGDNGVILHFNGTQWSQVPSGTTEHLYGADFVSTGKLTYVYAAGTRGTVLRN